jgi:hypothetical protein
MLTKDNSEIYSVCDRVLLKGPVQKKMECAECDNLWCHYESLTFSATRIQNALEIAERMYDEGAAQRFTGELHGFVAQLQDARAALARHRNSAHPFLGVADLAAE